MPRTTSAGAGVKGQSSATAFAASDEPGLLDKPCGESTANIRRGQVHAAGNGPQLAESEAHGLAWEPPLQQAAVFATLVPPW